MCVTNIIISLITQSVPIKNIIICVINIIIFIITQSIDIKNIIICVIITLGILNIIICDKYYDFYYNSKYSYKK
jgi:hypothetical protein